MDHDQRMTAAENQDAALAASIVKAIPELERDYRLAEGPLSEQLMREIMLAMRQAAPAPWEVIETDYSVLLRSPGWKPSRGLGNGDAWLQINEVAEDGLDRTWLGVAVGAGPTQLGLELLFRTGITGTASAVMQEKVHADRLAKMGFRRTDAENRIFIPIAIDRLGLSKGYGENDLSVALAPVSKAVAAVVSGKLDLDALIEAVRTKSKGR